MLGPYVAARLTKNITFDALATWGRSDNHVNPLGTYEDAFTTQRSLVSGRLTGNWYFGPVRFTPNVSLLYFREKQQSYIDQIANLIPGQTFTLEILTFGPEFGYRFGSFAGGVLEPFVGLRGVWDFDKDANTIIGGIVVGDAPFHGQVEAGAVFQTPSGLSLRGAAAYDGIGEKHFNAYQGRLLVRVPFN